jgi:hypothetical protein
MNSGSEVEGKHLDIWGLTINCIGAIRTDLSSGENPLTPLFAVIQGFSVNAENTNHGATKCR